MIRSCPEQKWLQGQVGMRPRGSYGHGQVQDSKGLDRRECGGTEGLWGRGTSLVVQWLRLYAPT